jgi:hypothetical protein
VTIAELTAAPYLLSYGSSIYAKVTALNIYGASIQSLAGNGAVILTVPDKPVNLANNEAMTSATQIALSWAQGASNGGASVLDFTIQYKQEPATEFTVLTSAVKQQSYTAMGLVMGQTYTFQIAARNSYGLSAYSDPVSILAAQIPYKPTKPVTVVLGEDVHISWTAPKSGGSPITSYIVKI